MQEDQKRNRTDDGASIAASLTAASDPDKPYLGDETAVEDVVRQFAADVFSLAADPEQNDAKAAESFNAAVEQMALVFTGRHKDYAGIPDWHGGGQLAAVLARHFGYTDSEPVEIMRAHFSAFGTKVLDITKKAFEDNEDWEEDFDMLMENFLPTLQGKRKAFY
jgi:hypothetical protein